MRALIPFVMYLGSARERSGIVIYVASEMATGDHIWCRVSRESPISTGLTTVAVNIGESGRTTEVGIVGHTWGKD